TGQVIAVPIPEEYAEDSRMFEQAVDTAVSEAEANGVRGKESTPFLLKRVVELTKGASLVANIALVKNNARVASQISASLASMTGPFGQKRSNSRQFSSQSFFLQKKDQNVSGSESRKHEQNPLVVIGGSAIDVTAQVSSNLELHKPLAATSYPGTVYTSVGGVGQNIARAAHFLGADTVFVSAIGHDAYGNTVKYALEGIGMDTAHLQYPGENSRTAVYNALHSQSGDLVAAVADMEINGMISAQQIEEVISKMVPSVVGLDANISILATSSAITAAMQTRSCILFEPTSVPKCTSVLSALSFIKRSEMVVDVSRLVHIITPNQLELQRMSEVALELALIESAPLAETVHEMAEQHYMLEATIIRDALTLFPLFPVQIIKLGEKGAAIVSPSPRSPTTPIIRNIRPLKPSLIINSNGAGDSMVGAILASLYSRKVTVSNDGYLDIAPQDIDTIVSRAQKASILSLESSLAVSEKLCPELIDSD
ncbi:hypothetical protein LPJ73_006556, partial [Coemansia sp. RSA 2703]